MIRINGFERSKSMEYLTPEDIAIAKSNGISYERVNKRFYQSGWTKERSITEVVKKKVLVWEKYKDISLVAQGTFYDRIKKGMTPEQAALTPPVPNGGRLFRSVKVTAEMIEIAAKNGIGKNTLIRRVRYYKWDAERAVSEPIHTQKRSMKYREEIQ
jgi:hypothetical protein